MATPVSQAMISAISSRSMTKSARSQTSFEHDASAVCLSFYLAILRRSLLVSDQATPSSFLTTALSQHSTAVVARSLLLFRR